MQIAYIANSRFPSERAHMVQIVHMCNAFAQNAHTVSLFVTDRRTDITETPEAYYGVPLEFEVTRIPVLDIAGRSLSIPTWLHIPLFFLQRISFVWGVARVLRRESFDLVYGRDEWILWLLSKLIAAPVVWESHEARLKFPGCKLFKAGVRSIVISEGIKKEYLSQGIPRELLFVAHDAVDDSFFKPLVSEEEARDHLDIRVEKPVVLYIGGLDAWKGVDTLFRASELSDKFLVYVIGGKDREIEKYGEQFPRVTFLGRRPYKDLPVYQQAADILVIPNTAKNKTSAEYTSPLKLFAHMTSKKPLVVSDIPSLRGVLSDEEAYFFEPDNPKSLAETIERVVVGGDDAVAKLKSAYTKSKEYTWKKRVGGIISFITS